MSGIELSDGQIAELQRKAIAIGAPYMDHVGQCLARWRTDYLALKGGLTLDAWDERLVALDVPAEMTFPDLLHIELSALAANVVDGLDLALRHLREMIGAEELEVLDVLEITEEVMAAAEADFKAQAIQTFDAAASAANAEAERRRLPGIDMG